MLLHRETVHREMPGVERKCQIEVPSPVATQRLGDREDQIDREIRYPLAANNFDSGQYLSSIMRPMHPRQHRVVERLHPQRNPIHARLDPRPDDGNRDVPVSYTHLRAHETDSYLVCRLLLEKKKK